MKKVSTICRIVLLALLCFALVTLVLSVSRPPADGPDTIGPLGYTVLMLTVLGVSLVPSAALLFLPAVLYAVYLPPLLRMEKHPGWKKFFFGLFVTLHVLDLSLAAGINGRAFSVGIVIPFLADLLAIAAATVLYILSKKEIAAGAGDKPGAGPTGAPSV